MPNVFKVLAHRPAEFRAFFTYYNELMNKETGREHNTLCVCACVCVCVCGGVCVCVSC